jgi:membrane dipeptidase
LNGDRTPSDSNPSGPFRHAPHPCTIDFSSPICGNDARAIVRAIRYTTDLVGVEYVALGSDFDGAVKTPFDVTGITHITEALMQGGFSEADIRKIMGENILRVLRDVMRDE